MTSNGSNKFSFVKRFKSKFYIKIRKSLKEGLAAEPMRHLCHLPISYVGEVKSDVNLQEEMILKHVWMISVHVRTHLWLCTLPVSGNWPYFKAVIILVQVSKQLVKRQEMKDSMQIMKVQMMKQVVCNSGMDR